MATEDLEALFKRFLKLSGEPQAAALLCVAHSLAHVAESTKGLAEDSLGHEICMGVRKGLFGSSASDSCSVTDLGDAIGNAMRSQ